MSLFYLFQFAQLIVPYPDLLAKRAAGWREYRLLAEFGSAVLAGHPTGQGVEFVT